MPLPGDSPLDLDRLLLAVCQNESIPSYRDFELSLIPVARALLDGWTPDLSILQGVAGQRAGYLVDLLSGWMSETRRRDWRQKLAELAHPQDGFTPGPFFHRDPVAAPCQDELARHWGLTRGLNLARLRQALEPPYLC